MRQLFALRIDFLHYDDRNQFSFDATISISWVFIEEEKLKIKNTWIFWKLSFTYYSKTDENTKLIEIFTTLLLALWVFGLSFIICALGERMTSRLAKFEEELKRYDWYKLPIKMRRLYLIFLLDIQQPKHITCGNIPCTCETFKRVFDWDRFFM